MSLTRQICCRDTSTRLTFDISAWRRVWKLDRGVYEELCPGATKQAIKVTAKRNHHVLTVGKPQKRQSAVIKASAAHQSEISADQIQTFVRQTREILAHAYQLTYGKVTGDGSAVEPKIWVQGHIYRIVAEEHELTVQARGRGVILQAQGDTVTSECLTMDDLSRFCAEVSRLQHSYRLIEVTKATSSPCREQ